MLFYHIFTYTFYMFTYIFFIVSYITYKKTLVFSYKKAYNLKGSKKLEFFRVPNLTS